MSLNFWFLWIWDFFVWVWDASWKYCECEMFVLIVRFCALFSSSILQFTNSCTGRLAGWQVKRSIIRWTASLAVSIHIFPWWSRSDHCRLHRQTCRLASKKIYYQVDCIIGSIYTQKNPKTICDLETVLAIHIAIPRNFDGHSGFPIQTIVVATVV